MSNKVTELLRKMRDAVKEMSPEEISALYEAKMTDVSSDEAATYVHIERAVMSCTHSFSVGTEFQAISSVNHIDLDVNYSLSTESSDYGYAIAA